MFLRILLVLVCMYTVDSSHYRRQARVNSHRLRIGAFNVKWFGRNKISKEDVALVLRKIIRRYDLILIQEIRDKSCATKDENCAFRQLVRAVNQGRNGQYDYILGPREGRGSYKEQYGFIYRGDYLRPTLKYKYPDCANIFAREPYVVRFHRIGYKGVPRNFNFIPLHAKPRSAVTEMNALVAVYNQSIGVTEIKDAVIAGDLNADCSYVRHGSWRKVLLRTDRRFHWMIPDKTDTTTSKTDCAYDRIITTGSLIPNSYGAKVFRFDEAYNLTYAQAMSVSDHYPVEFFLK